MRIVFNPVKLLTMKRITLTILLLPFLLCWLAGCSKSELTAYTQQGMVYFYRTAYGITNDSTTLSFAIKADTLVADTVWLDVRIMGEAAPKDRVVKLEAWADSTTAVEGVDYTFLPSVIKAGAFTARLPVLIKRNAGQKTRELRLLVRLGTSADFAPGALGITSGQMPGATLKYLIKINDFLTKPANWESFLVYYFGAYSQVKYKLIIDATGRVEFLTSGADAVIGPTVAFYALQAQQLQAEMEAVNGPLLDENGNAITFPH